MKKLAKHFELADPGTTVKWITLEKSTLRQRITPISRTIGCE
ncbi:MAG: hypothetical protein WA888_13445 [Burkholderiaceae bacterium]